MAEITGKTTEQPNWLVGEKAIPAELKLMILEQIDTPGQIVYLAKAYPEWVSKLWNRYRNQLFPRALKNIFRHIDAEVRAEVLSVYHIRRIRKEYETAMESSVETQADRDKLQADLRSIINSYEEDFPELETTFQTILDLGAVVWDVHCLTYRYSNDAWRRVYDISVKTRPQRYDSRCVRDPGPPALKLTRIERLEFHRAFLNVEIYLLTKFWTNNQGQRHILDMGDDIVPYIPQVWNPADGREAAAERRQFGSCLRYIFDAYRGYVKKAARELNAPELPTRDDLQWVPNELELKEYLYQDDGTITPQGRPEIDFPQRSVSEEQRFLLWLCEAGIGPLERRHMADDRSRREELLLLFGRRDTWDTVELRHRFTRYDAIGVGVSHDLLSGPLNRHPVTSIYGDGTEQEVLYSACSPASACAPEFLRGMWDRDLPGRQRFLFGFPSMSLKDAIVLKRRGHWLTHECDTDTHEGHWRIFKRKDVPGSHTTLCGHQYMLDPEKYEMNVDWMPRNLFVGPSSEVFYF